MYAEGKGVKQDYKKAFEWYTKAAERKLKEAQFNLAIMYAEGKGVEQDFKEAFKWFTKAAEQGHAQTLKID